MSPKNPSGEPPHSCFPRVSGDEPEHTMDYTIDAVFSPRERG